MDKKSNANDPHVEANVEVIREYLESQFKGFGLADKPDAPLSHTFTVMKSTDEQYHLKVYWAQLSDQSHTLKRLNNALSRTM